MAARWTVLMLAALLVLAGCQEAASPCEGVQCLPCQKCVVGDGGLTCVVDLECDGSINPHCLKMGVPCADSTECCDGWCLKYSDGTGYCAKRDCQNDASCVNYNNDGREMCCVDVDGEFKVCLKIDPGCGCGIQDQTCGGDCACQLDSACDPNHTCLTGGDIAYCSHGCTTDSDCSDCSNLAVPEGTFSCVPTAGGVAYCTFLIPPCTSSSECAGGDECVPYLSPDGSALEGYCGRRGPLNVGDACSEDDDQCAGLCLKANDVRGERCSSVCAVDADCPAGMRCLLEDFCSNANCDADNAYAIHMCQEDIRCASGRDCLPDVEVCMPFLNEDGTGFEGWCQGPYGLLPTGSTCDADLDPYSSPPEQVCEALHCLFDFCSEVCELDSDCPGIICAPAGLDLPNGGTAVINMCQPDRDCSRPADCPEGQGCRPYLAADGASLEGGCTEGGDIATGAVCDPNYTGTDPVLTCESDFCMDDNYARAFCTEVCEVTADCPTDMVCELYEFCLADPCTEPANLASIDLCVDAP